MEYGNKGPLVPTHVFAKLRTAFNALAQYYGADERAREEVYREIRDRMSEPHRAYHNLYHVYELTLLLERHILSPADVALITAFNFTHDLRYNTNPIEAYKLNEPASAELADPLMGRLGMPPPDRQRLGRWILALATHAIDPQADLAGAIALDHDMAIIGATWQRYSEYTGQIRAEWAHVPDDVFNRARLEQFIEPTLAKPQIFMTYTVKARFENQARDNLRRERSQLQMRLKRAP